jgi:acyl-CoA thioester hydrolase
MNQTFIHPVRVYWEDTDAGGVVYHAQYLAFLERARSEWLRALGKHQERMREELDIVFAVRSMRIDFRAPARLDDALEVTAALRDCRRASLVFAQSIRRGDTLLLDAEVRVAALSAATFRPRPIPEPLYAELKDLEIPVSTESTA